MDEIEQDLSGLRPVFILSQVIILEIPNIPRLQCLLEVVGVGLVVMMSVWTGHFMGGFAGQSDPKLEFNWHPLLLTISLIYLYGNGILIYRLARNERKSKLKLAHATVMGSATVLACFGIKAGLDSNTFTTFK